MHNTRETLIVHNAIAFRIKSCFSAEMFRKEKSYSAVRSRICRGILSSEIKESVGFILPRGSYRTQVGLHTNER